MGTIGGGAGAVFAVFGLLALMERSHAQLDGISGM